MISTMALDVEATSGGAVTVAPTAAGGVEVTLPVRVEVARKEGASDAQNPKYLNVELFALPSTVKALDTVLGRTLVTTAFNQLAGARWTTTLNPVLALSHADVHALERVRAGRAAELELNLQLWIGGSHPAGAHTFKMTHRIAASDWADRLGEIGLFRAVHVTLPLSARTPVTTNALLQNELERAERQYRDADYSGCVATIRDVWDPIIKELNSVGSWDAIIDGGLPTEIANAVKTYAKDLRTLVNKGHHRGVTAPSGTALYQFTAQDAEFVMEAALAFLRYLGKLPRP